MENPADSQSKVETNSDGPAKVRHLASYSAMMTWQAEVALEVVVEEIVYFAPLMRLSTARSSDRSSISASSSMTEQFPGLAFVANQYCLVRAPAMLECLHTDASSPGDGFLKRSQFHTRISHSSSHSPHTTVEHRHTAHLISKHVQCASRFDIAHSTFQMPAATAGCERQLACPSAFAFQW